MIKLEKKLKRCNQITSFQVSSLREGYNFIYEMSCLKNYLFKLLVDTKFK